MHKVRFSLCILMSLCLCGCSSSLPGMQEKTVTSDVVTLGKVPDYNYVHIPQKPLIITDQMGYARTGKKIVYIRGNSLGEEFELINSGNGQIAYTAPLTLLSEGTDGEKSLYMGDFSNFETSGVYRIYQADVGYSYEFRVDNSIYKNLYMDSYSKIEAAQHESTSGLIYTLSNLMLTKEVYSEAFCDKKYIDSNMRRLLAHQNAGDGAVFGALLDEKTLEEIALSESDDSQKSASDSMVSLSTTAEFAGVMAQYYSLYKDMDAEMAAECLNAATKAFAYVEKTPDGVSNDSYYYAACEMYKATGQTKYLGAINWYDAIDVKSRTTSEYDYTFLADVAYLKSGYRINYDRCDSIMRSYLNEAVHISDSSDKMHFYVQDDVESFTMSQMLDNMMKLGLVGYVVSGHEYAGVQKNYIHYISGMNEEKINHFYSVTNSDDVAINDNVYLLSKMIFVLGGSYAG